MNSKNVLLAIAALLLVLLLSASIAAAGGSPAIPWYVIGGGGGGVSIGNYQLDSSIGQPVAGMSSNSPYEGCAGFWCWLMTYHLDLPLLNR